MEWFEYLTNKEYRDEINNEKEFEHAVELANSLFNTINIEGVNYITYNGVIVSTRPDDDGTLLIRLNELRNSYIQNYRE